MGDTGGVSSSDLADRLAAALPPVLGHVRIEGLARMTGGASRETWAFDAVTDDGMHHELVLRRDPAGRSSGSGTISREAAAMRLAAGAGVAVPGILMSTEDPQLWGSPGIVMDRVVGEALPRRVLTDDRYAGARGVLVGQCADALAALHGVDPDLLDPPLETDPLEMLRATIDGIGLAVPTFEDALVQLDRSRPEPCGRAIVHGDFRLGNLMVTDTGLSSVLDWELVHVGDPAEDLGWLCARAWRFGAWAPVAGLGERSELISAYRAAGGVEVPEETLRWWETLAALRWGVICLVQTSVHLSGAHRSVELAAIGRRVAETEWDLLDALRPAAAAAALEDHRSVRASDDGGVPDAGLYGRPTAVELVAAVEDFLDRRVRPELEATGADRRLTFHARVAANALGVVRRELAAGVGPLERRSADLATLGVEDEAGLAAAIRRGGLVDRDEDLARVLAIGVVERLAVADPRGLPDADPPAEG